MPDRKSNPQRAVILTTTSLVYQEVRIHLTDIREETHPQGTIYEQGTFISSSGQPWIVAIVEAGEGNTNAAFEVERAINHFEPSLILFVGIAGGLRSVRIGDVVAATKVYGYESGRARLTFELRPDVGESSHRLVQRAKAEGRKKGWLRRIHGRSQVSGTTPQVWVGPIAAGEKVIASTSSDLFEFLRTHYDDALAVEMEGRGFLQATHASQRVEALIIRGIGNLIDEKSEADSVVAKEIAARHASAFTFEILARLDMVALRQKGQASVREKTQRTTRPDKNQMKRVVDHERLEDALPTSDAIEPVESKEQTIKESDMPETTTPEVFDPTYLHALHDLVQEQHPKVKKLYGIFVSREDIYPDQCERTINVLNELYIPIEILCHSSLLTDYVVQMTLENISEHINQLRYILQSFRHICPPSELDIERQQYEKELNRIRSGLDKLLKSLEQLNNDKQILTDLLEQ